MWSPILLLLLIGLVTADPGWNQEYSASSNNPGWRDNHEYIYKMQGRTLASLREVQQQHSGVLYSAEIRIQPRAEKIQAKIVNAQYSPIHAQWNDVSHIPEDQLSWQPLQLSSRPFQITMKYGVITDLIVDREIPNWEANMIKSIVSQFQLNTNGHKLVQSSMTSLPQNKKSAVFKTMEDTITGNTETLYTIKQIPDYMIQKTPLYNVEQFQKGEQSVYEVNKYKNYTNYEELPSYFYGFGDMQHGEPATNQMSDSFTRISNTHAVLTGNLNRYTIQHSVTYDEIFIRPTLQDQQKGSVVSVVNVTLQEVTSQYQPIEQLSSPLSLGSLVYTYERPFSPTNLVRERRRSSERKLEELRDRNEMREDRMLRVRRALDQEEKYMESNELPQYLNVDYAQDTPLLNQAPQSPFLPYTVGYKGMSVKKGVDISKSVQDLANEIAESLQQPEEIVAQDALNKFVTMTSLIRLMDAQELQTTAGQLYSQSNEKQKSDAWAVFRDSVAESGTGPAFSTIHAWINEKKIKGIEASQIVSSMLRSIRQPTEEYMKSLFDFIQSPAVQSQWPLNNTALLGYSQLLHKVYVNKQYSRKHFPVHSFGDFRSEQAKKFVKEIVIPHFAQQLHQAISNAETQKIHIYIRVLGNIGHPQILSAFEPYLEGKKQASQFQRFLMVLAMDKLAEVYPTEARSVLFKIYQNSAETEQVRIGAVHQLTKTNPPPEMLQYMASFTKIDKHEHVNAAVKFVIQMAADNKDDKRYKLREAAESAKPLLTKKIYGLQQGAYYIKSYFYDELHNQYYTHLHGMGSRDTYYPKGIFYKSSARLGGINQHVAHIQAMVSSFKQLTYVLEQQTTQYKNQREEQSKYYEQQKQHPWSSQKIAELFNLKSEESEQLEGMLDLGLDEPFNYYLSFDNNTIKSLPQLVKYYDNTMRNGLKMDYTKVYNQHEITYSVPTATGLPFIYSYDNPTLVKIEGRLQVQPTPSVVEGDKFAKPQSIQISSQLGVTVSSKIQGRLSFTTPFDHQMYLAGYDKEWQVHVPLHGKYELNLERQELEAELEVKEPHRGARLFHYKSEPYTSKVDITNFEPVSIQSNTKYLRQKNLRGYERVLGKKDSGIAIQVSHAYERQSFDVDHLLREVYQNGPAAGLKQLWNDNPIQYRKLQLTFLPEESTSRKVKIHLSGYSKYKVELKSNEASPMFADPQEILQNPQEIENKVGADIKNVKIRVVRGSVEFEGSNTKKHVFAGAIASSIVDYKTKVGLYYQRQGPDAYVMSFQARSTSPNTQTMDVKFALDNDPVVVTQMEIAYGPSYSSATKIEAMIKQNRSEERIQYLKELPEYKQCQEQMAKGNKQLPACLNITTSAGTLDRILANVQYKNLKPEHEHMLHSLYHLPIFKFFPNVRVNPAKSEANQLEIQAGFDADLRFVNVSLKTDQEEIKIKDLPVNEITKEIFVPHAVYNLKSRMTRYYLQIPAYDPTCVIDQTMVNTFSNLTYPLDISRYWTVILQSVYKKARQHDQPQSVQEQFRYQREHYAVLVRKNTWSSQKKDVKITFSSPETSYKVIDITMQPSNTAMPKAKVSIDGTDVFISNKQTHDIGNGYAQIYSLSSGEIRVTIDNYFSVIYDGVRVRVSAQQGQPMDSIIGLCGQFNNQETEDFLTSQNCLARNPKEFVESFEIEGDNGQRIRQEFAGQSNKCFEKQQPLYVDVISARDSRRQDSPMEVSTGSCTRFQTRYVEENGEICFTIRPLPVCSHVRCQPSGFISKSVSVVCIQNSSVAQLWKQQIDRGASPDFSRKKESKTMTLQVPQSCVE